MLSDYVIVPPIVFVVFAAMFGGILGSFVNAAIHRLPRRISMLKRSRSFCPKCDQQIGWYDNIPIISYLVLGGKCRNCKEPIPRRYLIVELLVAGLFAFAAYNFFVLNRSTNNGWLSVVPWSLLFVQFFLIADLICVTFTDLETWYIPDKTTSPWILVGLALAPIFPEALHSDATYWTDMPRLNGFIDAFQGVVWGGGVLWLVGFITLLLIGKEGMGGGDVFLVAMIGAFLGWKAAFATILIGVFIGCFVGISVMWWDRYQQKKLGSKWKPRKATFELDEDDLEEEPGNPIQFIIVGGVVLVFEIILLVLYMNKSQSDPTSVMGLLPTKEMDAETVSPVSLAMGAVIGCFMLLAYPVYKKMIREDRLPKGEIKENEDGKKEEVMEGNYIPFGPSLAVAGLIVAFYGPVINVFAWFYFFVGGSWDTYILRNPLPYEFPFL